MCRELRPAQRTAPSLESLLPKHTGPCVLRLLQLRCDLSPLKRVPCLTCGVFPDASYCVDVVVLLIAYFALRLCTRDSRCYW